MKTSPNAVNPGTQFVTFPRVNGQEPALRGVMDHSLGLALQVFLECQCSPRLHPWLSRVQEHDNALYEHTLLTGAVASIFGFKVGLQPDDQRLLVMGTLLHDVGKIEIAPELLHKVGPLDGAERRELERHPEFGHRLLLHDGWEPEILEIVKLHHERLDGSGYPQGLTAEKIGTLIRMVTLCDVFSALIEERSYRPTPRRPLEIMAVMDAELDGALLAAFSRTVPDLAYRAQRLLKLQYAGGSFAISRLAPQPHTML